ncbi:hypothetical protein KHS38_16485 [Mucilaginibacter sp. Bleaf8]|uniref:hypothetical protein n=1 Tax=Mucilaginibacter sp. Bleaf8 TaxID=2834430 RepID=UPI001BCEDB43|nr:hypothetical protein [Mucilaginibacter sp. Bleaf8]MBS7566006.1 hypothetical protein [Mucilaginibacter sp. Bleaf8]
MRIKLFALLVFMLTGIHSKSQSISYTIPNGYEENISKGDYKKLVDLSIAVISKRYAIDEVQEGSIRLKPNEDFSIINLHNLIGKCVAVSDKAQWVTVINNHFNSMFSSAQEQKQFNPADFASIRKKLSVRVYTEATMLLRGGIDGFIVRKDLEGTYTVLMLDLPSAFTPVSEQSASIWHKTNQDLFDVALHNIKEVSVEKKTQTFKVNGKELEVSFIVNEDYAASFVLDLEHNAPEMVGEWGTVISIPNKGIAALCKVSKSHPVDFVNFIQGLYSTAENYYTKSDYPVSKQFFWYYKGRFTPVNVTTGANGSVNVIAPVELSKLMTTSD